jgi:type IV secretory pathway protease TraF
MRDSRGRMMPQPAWERRVLGSDEYWIQSIYSMKSFDSRYFGPVKRLQIVDLRLPILVVRPAVLSIT